jgi:hypothetical protein
VIRRSHTPPLNSAYLCVGVQLRPPTKCKNRFEYKSFRCCMQGALLEADSHAGVAAEGIGTTIVSFEAKSRCGAGSLTLHGRVP